MLSIHDSLYDINLVSVSLRIFLAFSAAVAERKTIKYIISPSFPYIHCFNICLRKRKSDDKQSGKKAEKQNYFSLFRLYKAKYDRFTILIILDNIVFML